VARREGREIVALKAAAHNLLIPRMSTFTLLHVAISLAGIVAGFVVMLDLMMARLRPGWTGVFLWCTLATSVTGFMFPFNGFTPAIGLGIISVVVLALTFRALYHRKLAGGSRTIFVIGAVLAQYFNCFVLVVQSFQKIPALHALAPTQKEPPFAIAQGALLGLFFAIGWSAVKRFKPVK
jgi:hypothetical protein